MGVCGLQMERIRLVPKKSLADDLLWGAQAIAGHLGLRVEQVYYLVSKRRLPVTKLGRGVMVARKSELEALFSSNRR